MKCSSKVFIAKGAEEHLFIIDEWKGSQWTLSTYIHINFVPA